MKLEAKVLSPVGWRETYSEIQSGGERDVILQKAARHVLGRNLTEKELLDLNESRKRITDMYFILRHPEVLYLGIYYGDNNSCEMFDDGKEGNKAVLIFRDYGRSVNIDYMLPHKKNLKK